MTQAKVAHPNALSWLPVCLPGTLATKLTPSHCTEKQPYIISLLYYRKATIH